MTPTATVAPAARIQAVSKTFAGVKALHDVSFDLRRGTITALLGMNGSGKSTLIKILAGVYHPDSGGEITIDDQSVELPLTPTSAHRHGLRFLHQDVGLVEALTVADNFAFVDRFRGHGFLAPIDKRAQREHVRRTLARFGVHLDPDVLVSTLTPTERTMVGVARALQDDSLDEQGADHSKILVLDEPTAALPPEEVDVVLSALEELRARGGTIVYVSHRTDEVARIADQIVVLRDGHLIVDEPAAGMSAGQIVSRVIGKELERLVATPAPEPTGQVVLSAQGLTGNRLRDVDFTVAAGEVVGIGGLVGCGRSELMRVLGGAQRSTGGAMMLAGQTYRPSSPADALKSGVASSPQERRREGIVLSMSVAENLTLGRLVGLSRKGKISHRAERQAVDSLISAYSVKTAGSSQIIALLSGGNQQKVMLGRAAGYDSTVLLLDEPTQGVDAHAKAEIAQLIRGLAERSVAVVVASTDFEDFVGLAHRVIILDRGRVVGSATGADVTVENLSLLCAEAASASPEVIEP